MKRRKSNEEVLEKIERARKLKFSKFTEEERKKLDQAALKYSANMPLQPKYDTNGIQINKESYVPEENSYAFNIVEDEYVLKNRNVEEIINLMKILKNSGFSNLVYKIILDKNVLEKRSAEEQIRIIKTFESRKSDRSYDYNIYHLATNQNLLKKPVEDQIGLMLAVINSDFYEIKNFVLNQYVLEYRSAKEIIELIRILEYFKYDEDVYKIALNRNILENKQIEDQIELMVEEYKKKIDKQIKSLRLTSN